MNNIENKYYIKNKEKVLQSSRNRILKIVYDLSISEYNELRKLQDFKCKICSMDEKDLNYKLCVDHCHNTEKIRGLLCKPCNLALGAFDDNIEILENTIKYLEKYEK